MTGLNTKNLETIRHLRADAASLDSFHQTFADQYEADRQCDKKGYGFGTDNRFAAFRINTSFDSWRGYYGNSGCSAVLGVGERVVPFIIRAMNVHQKELFATAARLMREDAAKLAGDAATELADLQKLLDEAIA
jgi:hypothetical protein